MRIYVKIVGNIQTIRSKLFALRYKLIALRKGDFYYGISEYDEFQGEECSRINFEILGTQNQIAFLTLIDKEFEVIGVKSPEDGEEHEREAMEWWRKTHI